MDVDELLDSLKTYHDEDPANWPVVMPLKQHQIDILKKSKDEKGWGLWLDMGGMKTNIVLQNAFYLYLKEEIDALVIIAPNGVYENWTLRELPKHRPPHISAQKLAWPKNYNSKKNKKLLELFAKPAPGKLKVFAINIEANSKMTNAGYKYLVKFIRAMKGRIMIAIDESTCIKNPKAGRTKNIIKLRKACAYRRALSGTPITQSPLDVFTQLDFLDPSIHGCRNYYAFEGRYGVKETMFYGNRSFQKVTGFRELDDLKSRMSSKGSFYDKAQMDLPDKIMMPPRYVELTSMQKVAYNNMLDFFRAEMNDGVEVTASTALVKLMRLQQILLGWAYTEDGDEVSIPHNRIEGMQDILDEAGNQQSIIWSTFKGPLNEMNHYFGKKAAYFYGSIDNDERQRGLDAFMAGDLQYFVANQMSAGHGLTITAATNNIYYNNSFNLEQRLQSEDRSHRPGQTDHVTYTDLMVKDTIEEGIVGAQNSKIQMGSLVLDTYKKLIRS